MTPIQEIDAGVCESRTSQGRFGSSRRSPKSRDALRNCTCLASFGEVIWRREVRTCSPAGVQQSSSAEGLARSDRAGAPPRGTAVAIGRPDVSRQARRTYQPTCGAAASSAPQQGGAFPRGRIAMSMLLNLVKSVRNEEGQDLLEYALLVALIALIAIGAVGMAGQSVDRPSSRTSRGSQLGAALVARDLRRGPRALHASAHRSVDGRGGVVMPSPVAVAQLKRLANARLRREEEGQDLLEYALLLRAHRARRARRCHDGW